MISKEKVQDVLSKIPGDTSVSVWQEEFGLACLIVSSGFEGIPIDHRAAPAWYALNQSFGFEASSAVERIHTFTPDEMKSRLS